MFGVPDGVVRFIVCATMMRCVLGPEAGKGFEEGVAFLTWVEVVER
jgi:hypothetical protein